MERLTERRDTPLVMSMWGGNSEELKRYNRLAAYEDTGLTPEEVAELARAKADGRLAVLLVKRGDTIFRLCGTKNRRYVGERWVSAVKLAGDTIVVHSTAEDVLGKTVFLTREAAETALNN